MSQALELLRERAQSRVDEAQLALVEHRQALSTLLAKQDSLSTQSQASWHPTPEVSAQHLHWHNAWQRSLAEQLRRVQAECEAAQRQLDASTLALQQAQQKVMALDIVLDGRAQAARQKQARAEQKQLDELGTRAWLRSRKALTGLA